MPDVEAIEVQNNFDDYFEKFLEGTVFIIMRDGRRFARFQSPRPEDNAGPDSVAILETFDRP